MFKTTICLVSIFLVSLDTQVYAADEQLDGQQREAVAATAKLYLESSNGYVAGDLITESQIEELQQYLQITRGKSPATHSGLSNRAVKDRAPLARFFYSENGASSLRAAANELGGYAKIDALSHHREGRELLKQAIMKESATDIVASIEIAHSSISNHDISENSSSRRHLNTIYTLDDFLEAAFPSGSTEQAPQEEISQP